MISVKNIKGVVLRGATCPFQKPFYCDKWVGRQLNPILSLSLSW